jgi:probable F420-dependent oxidoreductase
MGFEVWAPLDMYLPLAEVPDTARRVESMGFHGLLVIDSITDGFLAAQAAIGAIREIRVGTAALVCFPRSPMTVAVAAWNLQAISGGRFHLGLGPLVRGNIVRKYSTPWTPPAPRMREYVQSLKAIFDCWQNGTPLDYRGEHYQFTRMQDFAKPPPIEHPDVPIHLAGIGPNMTALAGEIADALVAHGTNSTPRFLRERTLPWLARGASRANREVAEVTLFAGPMCATGRDEAAVRVQREQQRSMLAKLYSTPSYWPTLDLYGWRERGEHLNRLVRENRWDELDPIVTDEMLDTLIVAAPYAELADALRKAYGEITNTVMLTVPKDPADDDAFAAVVQELRSL